MTLFFIGPSGCGKDTQIDLLKDIFKLPIISTGLLLNDLFSKGDPDGIEAQKYYSKGKWVPDDLMNKILGRRLDQDDCKDGFILNGYPRTENQAISYDVKFSDLPVDKVICFTLTDEEAIERLSNRRICEDCKEIYHLKYKRPKDPTKCDDCGGKLYQRDDDQPDAIKKRLESFRKDIEGIRAYYEKSGRFIEIDATPSIDEIQKVLREELGVS